MGEGKRESENILNTILFKVIIIIIIYCKLLLFKYYYVKIHTTSQNIYFLMF